jgi:hypothetical protein
MKISIRKRLKSTSAVFSGGVSADREGRSTVMISAGPVQGEIALTEEELFDMLVSRAPYGKQARDEFFARLRAEADRRVPTQY